LYSILVDIGDEQSIEESHSTFSSHVARVAAILNQAGPGSLVLLDELGAGTEPQQGAAIACGVLRELQRKGATVIATTHLSEIIGFVHRSEGMINAGMEYDATTYSPLYRLVTGEPGHSRAIEIAGKFGMPRAVLDFAREMLGRGGEEFTSLLSSLHKKRRELEEAEKRLKFEHEQLELEKVEVKNRMAQVDQARREAKEKGWREAEELISATRRRINELIDEYRREKRSATLEKLKESEQALTRGLKPRGEAAEKYMEPETLKPGDTVLIGSLGHKGTVLTTPGLNGKVRLRAGTMDMEVNISDLLVPVKKGEKKARQPTRQSWNIEPHGGSERELKLIGERVENALALLETFLNDALIGGVREVRIIHGIGTGRLRNAVREHLANHPLVLEQRPGNEHEGRDGTTVALFRI